MPDALIATLGGGYNFVYAECLLSKKCLGSVTPAAFSHGALRASSAEIGYVRVRRSRARAPIHEPHRRRSHRNKNV
ncbi:hypothetical protein EVAR_94703_1 [Eumeta japonica]|uniref:Uncharacterized protein n=1 Tax=Eumeta variegata TaxID=151549 RepID=A0A4C1UVK3_EUMVA|nr:hypothetical protein EVAR_94703_1 [Eumeta japonica]